MLYARFVRRPALLRWTLRMHLRLRWTLRMHLRLRGTLRIHLRLGWTLRTHLRLRWALRMDLRLGWTLRMHFRWCANGRLRTGRRLELGSARIHGSIPTLEALVVIDARIGADGVVARRQRARPYGSLLRETPCGRLSGCKSFG